MIQTLNTNIQMIIIFTQNMSGSLNPDLDQSWTKSTLNGKSPIKVLVGWLNLGWGNPTHRLADIVLHQSYVVISKSHI